ncbi:multidrug ABC transporter ATP-binding protein [Kitasatospora herbaricolor]|uniref:ABC transporter ATP-binding protein n=1 Tax=Kitasatospora herbaricolor TaxID=68217 RepID=UPI001748FA2B|nr:ABC transporter ATP-binding protein [Kitasatospora herbaricolor]MDQ0309570.1 ABC-2 type transport system ATP-binding protein [Kitasatospora herbaricolor]GGV00963.1 multidrug ABC transporter ATP-binding protein [Kitasatospora herbaricolor]
METSHPQPPADHVIEVAGLHRRYGPADPAGFDAVRGVDLTVRRGELFALLGTNGAGKTSTMELIEGLAAPTGGQVRVLGHDPYRERGALRPRIGIMLQEGGFPGDLTVAETGRAWAGITSGARPGDGGRTLDEALALVGLTGRRGVRVKQLSGGERRRLDLAVALLGRPEVLFLDEPSTGLDPEARAATWRLIRDLRARGTTVLLTTHYLEEAEELADRLAIMHRGRIVTTGTVAEVIAGRPSRISFELPEREKEFSDLTLPPLAGAEVRAEGRRITVQSPRLQDTLTELLGWAAHHRLALGGLDARSASLEEAFLAIAAGAEEQSPEAPAVPARRNPLRKLIGSAR